MRERQTPVVFIGPYGAGKSTVAQLVAARLARPYRNLDARRDAYYAEIGYDTELAAEIRERLGWDRRYRYWKPFEAHAVGRFLADYPGDVLDLGAGHSVYESDALFERVQRALAPVRNVVLLLPSPDAEESVRILKARHGGLVHGGVDFDRHFVTHHSNRDLATLTVYNGDQTPEETAAEVVARLR